MTSPAHSVRRFTCLLVAAAAAGCATHMGAPNPALLEKMAAEGAFGGRQSVRICALLEPGITEAMARRLVDEAWNETEAKALELRMEIVSAMPWKSESIEIESIMSRVRAVPVGPGCDRVVAFLDHSDSRSPRLMGGVSLIHGFVVASTGGLASVLFEPTEAARHELYHLVGCGHAPIMDECYRRIALAKRAKKGPEGFFPVFLYLEDDDIRRNCGENVVIEDRAEANRIARLRDAHMKLQAAGRSPPPRLCPSSSGH